MALDPHLPFLRQRWEAGCHNIAQFYRELVARGYPHSYHSVHEQLVRLLPEGKKNAAKGCDLSAPPLSSRQATFLFLRRLEELEADEQESLITLRHLHPEIDLASDLVQQFARCCAQGQENSLTPDSKKSELARFANSSALSQGLS